MANNQSPSQITSRAVFKKRYDRLVSTRRFEWVDQDSDPVLERELRGKRFGDDGNMINCRVATISRTLGTVVEESHLDLHVETHRSINEIKDCIASSLNRLGILVHSICFCQRKQMIHSCSKRRNPT